MKHSLLFILAISLFAFSHVDPAAAQVTRTWVSGVGSDGNDCSRTSPCLTFTGAIGKTDTGGEINCLDQGGFGNVTINKSISIRCVGVTAGVQLGSVINTPANHEVLLEGLDIAGLGLGIDGIRIIRASKDT